MSAVQSVHHFLNHALQNDSRLYLLGEDLELRPDTSGLLERHPDQVKLLPASDNSLVGVAVGISMAGHPVIVQLASASSLPHVLAMLPAFGSEFPTSVIVRVPIAPNECLSLEALLAYPHLQVHCPHNANSVVRCLEEALSQGGPTIILEDLNCRTHSTPASPAAGSHHVEIWAWGSGIEAAQSAAEALQLEGIQCRIQALTRLHPIPSSIGSDLYETGRVVLVNLPTGLLSTIHKTAFWRLEHHPVFCAAQHDSIKSAVHTVMTP
jgi:pyruvate/2-oxoglutarate/acetoin dehydrogenase E1 component